MNFLNIFNLSKLNMRDLGEKMIALRRHQRNRIILKRYEKVKMGRWHVKEPGYLAKNNTVCSCWMCGNPRKYFGEITIQEKKSRQEWPIVCGDLF